MTEQSREADQGSGEVAALATPDFTPNPVAATSEKAFDEEALVAKIVDRLAPEIDKRFQSAKDKRFSTLDKLGGSSEALLKMADYIKAAGGDAEKAVREYQRDAAVEAFVSQQTQQGSPAAVANRTAVDTASVQSRTAELLKEAEIAFDDPEYVALTKKPYRNPDEFYQSVTKFTIKRAKQGIQPGPASNVGDNGGRAPQVSQQTETDKLLARQSELSRKSHLNAAEKAELIDVKSRLRAKIGA